MKIGVLGDFQFVKFKFISSLRKLDKREYIFRENFISHHTIASSRGSKLWKITYGWKRLVCYNMGLLIFTRTITIKDLLSEMILIIKI